MMWGGGPLRPTGPHQGRPEQARQRPLHPRAHRLEGVRTPLPSYSTTRAEDDGWNPQGTSTPPCCRPTGLRPPFSHHCLARTLSGIPPGEGPEGARPPCAQAYPELPFTPGVERLGLRVPRSNVDLKGASPGPSPGVSPTRPPWPGHQALGQLGEASGVRVVWLACRACCPLGTSAPGPASCPP